LNHFTVPTAMSNPFETPQESAPRGLRSPPAVTNRPGQKNPTLRRQTPGGSDTHQALANIWYESGNRLNLARIDSPDANFSDSVPLQMYAPPPNTAPTCRDATRATPAKIRTVGCDGHPAPRRVQSPTNRKQNLQKR